MMKATVLHAIRGYFEAVRGHVRNKFAHYYQLSDASLEDLSGRAVVALDASFLLDLYRYSSKTADQMFLVLTGLKSQIWLPHQAAAEFHKNRVAVVAGLKSKYDAVLSRFDNDGKKLLEAIEGDCVKHPNLDADKLLQPLEKALEQVREKVKTMDEKHQKVTTSVEHDSIWSKIDSLFDGKVGELYREDEYKSHEQEGKRRIEHKIPPGFKDGKKDEPCGDYIIWRQLLDYCKSEGKPAFFVTSDVKEDWWQKSQGARLGALPALRKEFYDVTGQEFHLYETEHFIKLFAPKFKVEPAEAVKEINRVQRDATRTVYRNEQLSRMLASERENSSSRLARDLERHVTEHGYMNNAERDLIKQELDRFYRRDPDRTLRGSKYMSDMMRSYALVDEEVRRLQNAYSGETEKQKQDLIDEIRRRQRLIEEETDD